MALTNKMINQRREETCMGITAERKYYHTGSVFVKRSLRPSEWQVSHIRGTIHVPRQGGERLLNEAAALQFVAERTAIPVPKLLCSFEDDGAVYLVTEYVEGVGMDSLGPRERQTIAAELEVHVRVLHSLRSCNLGGPSGLVVPPYRVTLETPRDDWNLRASDREEYMFCHNDLSQQNVIVDPDTLKIAAIIDWEYAGFYPEFFERRFFERNGPSVAMEGEEDDAERLVEFLKGQLVD